MGFFSFFTQDTERSICNNSSHIFTFPVTMKDNKGNSWTEIDYEGYGIFGGKDFYELLAEMNGKATREEGIELYFDSPDGILYPSLNEDRSIEWSNERVEDCPDQGFFYPEEDEDEDEDEDYYEDDLDDSYYEDEGKI